MKKILKKIVNRETILYGIIGILTSLLNIGLLQLLLFLKIDYKIGNIFVLIVVKLTAYVLNKKFVFLTHCRNFRELCNEFFRYFITRGATMLIDYIGLIILVEAVGLREIYGKIIVTFVVIILNYIIGKKFVFRDLTKRK